MGVLKYTSWKVYFRNWSKSSSFDYLRLSFVTFLLINFFPNLQEIRKHLQFKLLLSDLLIKPVQRVTKYQLILKDLLKYSKKIGNDEETSSVTKAIGIMQIIPKTANDMMDVERIEGFDVRTHMYSKRTAHKCLK